jgi:hypothetical protein
MILRGGISRDGKIRRRGRAFDTVSGCTRDESTSGVGGQIVAEGPTTPTSNTLNVHFCHRFQLHGVPAGHSREKLRVLPLSTEAEHDGPTIFPLYSSVLDHDQSQESSGHNNFKLLGCWQEWLNNRWKRQNTTTHFMAKTISG